MALTKIQLVTATITLAGDTRTQVIRHAGDPITWPEAQLLEHIHGEGAVVVKEHAGFVERSRKAEKARLVLRYGMEHADQCFPGLNPPMELKADHIKPAKPAKPAKAPIDEGVPLEA